MFRSSKWERHMFPSRIHCDGLLAVRHLADHHGSPSQTQWLACQIGIPQAKEPCSSTSQRLKPKMIQNGPFVSICNRKSSSTHISLIRSMWKFRDKISPCALHPISPCHLPDFKALLRAGLNHQTNLIEIPGTGCHTHYGVHMNMDEPPISKMVEVCLSAIIFCRSRYGSLRLVLSNRACETGWIPHCGAC